jgi:ABC-type multidrug transport system ATPase subunit
VLVTTHYMDEAEYCDRISIMVAGRIGAMGAPKELKRTFDVPSIDELFVRLARPSSDGAPPQTPAQSLAGTPAPRSAPSQRAPARQPGTDDANREPGTGNREPS